MLPLEAQTLDRANRYFNELGLTLPDSIVLATVVEGLRAEAGDAIFASRDEGFDLPQVRSELHAHECKLLLSFNDTHKRIVHATPRA